MELLLLFLESLHLTQVVVEGALVVVQHLQGQQLWVRVALVEGVMDQILAERLKMEPLTQVAVAVDLGVLETFLVQVVQVS